MSDLHPLSGAYAVDALDELERARFERHLAECPDCADEVRSLQEAASMLALTVDPTPFDLRSRVLAEIATVRPLPPQTQPAEVVRRTARRFPRLVAASVAAVLLIGGGALVANDALNNDTTVAPVAVSEQVMEAPDARTQSVAFDNGSKATLYHSKSVGRAVLVTQGMDAAPMGKVYEMWFQAQDGTFVPAGLMTSGGNQTLVLHGSLGSAKGVGITVEPASGSKTPSSVPIAMFNLAKSV